MARESKSKRDARRHGASKLLADSLHGMEQSLPDWCKSDSKSYEHLREFTSEVLSFVATAKVIDATNVSEFFYRTSSQEDWMYRDDFHSYALPFDRVFIELSRPSAINSEGKIHSASSIPARWGWLFLSRSPEDHLSEMNASSSGVLRLLEAQIESLTPKADLDVVKRAIQAAATEGQSALYGLQPFDRMLAAASMSYAAAKRGLPKSDDKAKWYVEGWAIVEYRGIVYVPGGCVIRVSHDGRMVDESPTWRVLGGGDITDPTLMGNATDAVCLLSQAAFMTLSFLGCKNVAINEVQPDAKLNRNRERAGVKPLVRHHTIDINPMRRVLRTEGGLETNGLKKALHICRGHFARYTEDKPLLGHTVGLVWRPAHTRGSLGNGIVTADYKITPS